MFRIKAILIKTQNRVNLIILSKKEDTCRYTANDNLLYP
jgi:hypothetical protein